MQIDTCLFTMYTQPGKFLYNYYALTEQSACLQFKLIQLESFYYFALRHNYYSRLHFHTVNRIKCGQKVLEKYLKTTEPRGVFTFPVVARELK